MNERIKQLAEQAKVDVITTKGMEHVVDGCYIVSLDKLEKFAELIVNECEDCVLWVGKTNKLPVEPIHIAHAINKRIKKYFGID